MKLYRGDRTGEAKKYRTDGIMTRLMKGGNPDIVEIAGLFEVARAHVMPATPSEERFLNKTPFLSFTEDRNRAERYARGRWETGILELSQDRFAEDTIVFVLDVTGMRNDGHDGVYVLDYHCNYALQLPYSLEEEELGPAASCAFCSVTNRVPLEEERIGGDGRRLHRIRLVRVAAFLRSGSMHRRYAKAIRQAEHDREWLIYPLDYIQKLRGYAARVPLSDIWGAERFMIVAQSRAPV